MSNLHLRRDSGELMPSGKEREKELKGENDYEEETKNGQKSTCCS